jgi:hypothetical protein
MKKKGLRALDICPGCGKRLLWGTIFEFMSEQRLKELGVQRVCWLHPEVKLEDADAIFMGDLIDREMRCACGGEVLVEVEEEWSEKCELCENRPMGKSWRLDAQRQCYTGLCEKCEETPEGRNWWDGEGAEAT